MLYAVIMAGGRGTRFWPRSRKRKPKHLLDIASGETILRETIGRIGPLVPSERILVVTDINHAEEVRKQTPEIPGKNIIAEPMGRSTACCIGLAALNVKKENAEGVMMVLPSDHYIAEPEKFRRVLAAAAQSAEREQGSMYTLGIMPTEAATGYGYLEEGQRKFSCNGEDVYEVRSVREKPDREEAERMLQQGGFFWNSGIFIGKARTFLGAIARWMPDLHSSLMSMEAALGRPEEASALKSAYESVAPVSFDYGILEKADNILLLRGDFGWSDVGTWDALWEILPKDDSGNAVTGGGLLIGRQAGNSLIHSPGKMVALLGVEDLIVVDTGDALLICKRGASQDVRHIVEILENKELEEYL